MPSFSVSMAMVAIFFSKFQFVCLIPLDLKIIPIKIQDIIIRNKKHCHFVWFLIRNKNIATLFGS
jgi:hypothetical protein